MVTAWWPATPGGVALLLGAAGLAVAEAAPFPVALAGYAAYLIALGRERWVAVPLVVLALPFSARPASLGPLEISTAEGAILLAAVVYGGAAARARLTPRNGGAFPSPPTHLPSADWAAAAFLGAGLLSLLVTEYPKQSLRELRWLIVEPIILYLIACGAITTPHRIAVTLWSVVVAGAVTAVAALAAAATSGELAALATRPAFPFHSPNHLGLFLGRAAAVAAAIALFGPGRRWAMGALAIIGLALGRSLSLGAWVGVGSAALALAALRGRRWLGAAGVLILVALLGVALVLPPERTLGRFDPDRGTALFRMQIWDAALRMAADHPVLGVGLDNFLYQYRGHYMRPDAWEEPNISHPHNWLLHFWLALGVPGLVAAVAMAGWLLQRSRTLLASPHSLTARTVGAATMATLVDTLVHGSFDNSYFLIDAAMLWWLVAALASVADRSSDPGVKGRAA